MSASRRALLVLAVALLLAGLAWLGSAVVSNTRLSLGTAEGEAGITVRTDTPRGTCSKALVPAFPWVRFACEPHDAADGSGPGGTSGARSPSLDTLRNGE